MGNERVKGVRPSDREIARRVEAYGHSIEKQAERARSLLQYLTGVAIERGVLPRASFVYPPDEFSNRMARGKTEPALYIDVEYGPRGNKEFILLKDEAELIRYQDRRKRPDGQLVYDADGAEKLSDIDYPFWAFWAAQELLFLIKRGKQPTDRS